jgi:plasmid maintenance system antidote protein VapI
MGFNEIVSDLNLNPTELSRALGVSDGHVHDLKNGRRRISLKLAVKLEKLTKRRGIVAAVVAQKTAQ